MCAMLVPTFWQLRQGGHGAVELPPTSEQEDSAVLEAMLALYEYHSSKASTKLAAAAMTKPLPLAESLTNCAAKLAAAMTKEQRHDEAVRLLLRVLESLARCGAGAEIPKQQHTTTTTTTTHPLCTLLSQLVECSPIPAMTAVARCVDKACSKNMCALPLNAARSFLRAASLLFADLAAGQLPLFSKVRERVYATKCTVDASMLLASECSASA